MTGRGFSLVLLGAFAHYIALSRFSSAVCIKLNRHDFSLSLSCGSPNKEFIMMNAAKRRLFLVTWTVFAVSATLTGQNAIAAGPPGGGRATPVVVDVVKEMALAPTVQVSGTVVSRQEAEIPAEIAGKLIWVAEVGTLLKRGDVLARLDDSLYQLQVLEQEAALKREQAQIKYLDSELKRLIELGKAEFATQSQIDKTQIDLDVAASELKVAEAKLTLATETLSRYKIKAPYDGVVLDRKRREGEWVANGNAVVSFANPASLEVRAQVTGASIAYLKTGSELQVQRDEQSVPVKIASIVPVGDSRSLLYEVRIAITGAGWRAGQTVRIAVPTGEPKRVLAVPRDALVLRRTGITVFRIVDKNTAEKVAVTTGIASGALIEVAGNLAVGDKVVVRGNERLRPGQEVAINGAGKP